MRVPMLAVGVVATWMAAAPAAADQAAEEAAVKTLVLGHLAAIANGDGQLIHGQLIDDRSQVDDPRIENAPGGWPEWAATAKASLEVKALTVAVDVAHHHGWFHALATVTMKSDDKRVVENWRISGIALDDKGWRLTHVVYSLGLPDATLFADAHPIVAHPTIVTRPSDKLATAAADWFSPGGFVRNAGATVAVSGTAPGEYGSGAAAALRYAKAWDQLGLTTDHLSGYPQGDGTIGEVEAIANLPRKDKTGVAMRLHAIVERQGDSWKWVCLHWVAFVTGPKPGK